MIPLLLADTPWRIEPSDLDLTQSEVTLLHGILVGRYDGYSMIYSGPGRPSAKRMRLLSSLGVVTFIDAAEGNWERGMWGARLTCVGANAVARNDGAVRLNADGVKDLNATGDGVTILDSHPGCAGGWLADGTCTDCPRLRPLDLAAYTDYLAVLDPDERAEQVKGPRLYCVEHGYLRRRHITTTKTCPLDGTDMHDRGLMRV